MLNPEPNPEPKGKREYERARRNDDEYTSSEAYARRQEKWKARQEAEKASGKYEAKKAKRKEAYEKQLEALKNAGGDDGQNKYREFRKDLDVERFRNHRAP